MRTPYDKTIKRYSGIYGIDAALIKAIIKNESNFNPLASRHEAHLNDTSWGLMQVLLTTAKWIIKDDKLTAQKLLIPETNINAGTAYLAYQKKRYYNVKDIIAAYNAGSVKKNKRGEYINKDYVTKVYNSYKLYRGIGLNSVMIGVSIGVVALSFTKRDW
jgi:soluble lytic murein transglycosylase-like protein